MFGVLIGTGVGGDRDCIGAVVELENVDFCRAVDELGLHQCYSVLLAVSGEDG